MRPNDTDDVFFAKILPRPNTVDDCWLWGAGTTHFGHGRFTWKAHEVRAHRWSYEYFIGPIPEGLTLDHLCKEPSCVNPWHLDPCPKGINTLRGDGITSQNRDKTQCVNGHPFDEANTFVTTGAKPRRTCRTCNREAMRRRRAAQR